MILKHDNWIRVHREEMAYQAGGGGGGGGGSFLVRYSMMARPEDVATLHVPAITTLLELCQMIARAEQDSKRLPPGTCVELFCHLGLALSSCDADYNRACPRARALACLCTRVCVRK